MKLQRVVITGRGTINPLGHNQKSTWEAIIAGTNGVGPITRFDSNRIKTHFAAEVKDFDAVEQFGLREARRMDRFCHFALAATEEAIADSKLVISPSNNDTIGVVLGSGIGGIGTLLAEAEKVREQGIHRTSPHLVPMMLPDSAPAKIAITFGLRGPNMSIATACASSTNAIGEAAAIIRRGAADVMVTGGAEAGIVELALAGFNNMGALSTRNTAPEKASRPFDYERDGFVAGEGAAILILERLDHALDRNAPIYAEILGYGASADAYHITAPQENGEGAMLAMQQALDDAQISPNSVDYINAHGTSTRLNDRSETIAIKKVFGDAAYQVPVSSTKSMTGHLLGAAGALEALFCIKAIETGVIPPTINYEHPDPELDLDYVPNTARRKQVRIAMSNSFGFGGHNATLIISHFDG